ncbi:hypothetical protein ON010_g18513 [Phytophthora cinnamomi]|nr:hypothetical protein ON010_g18513 [Phytophthora cinnamomi]
MVVEGLRQEKVAKLYEIPDRLRASFEQDTIELIADKFRVYDVSESGVLPRHEIFALLSGLGNRADLPDPFSVLPRLLASNNPIGSDRSGGTSSGGDMTLAELLLAIEISREAKRHSSAARLASMKILLSRAATTARRSLLAVGNADNNSQSVLDVPTQNKRGSTDSSKDVKGRGRRRGALKPRKSTLSQASECSGADGPIRASLSKPVRGSKAYLTPSNRKKTLLPRRSSSINSKQSEVMETIAADLRNEDPELQKQSVLSEGDPPLNVANSSTNDGTSTLEADSEAPPSSIITVAMYEPPSLINRKTIRIFLLLGGEHDGAICCTISLVLATKEITENEGIFYATRPSETTRTMTVLPIQKTLMTALRMLKKRVLIRMESGFEQRPADQLDVVDKMLRDLNKRQPHYSSPIIKTVREAAVMPFKQSVGVTPSARPSEIARQISLQRGRCLETSTSGSTM